MLSRMAAHSFLRAVDGILTAILTPLSHNKCARWNDNYLLSYYQRSFIVSKCIAINCYIAHFFVQTIRQLTASFPGQPG